jgi:hypothetical protein
MESDLIPCTQLNGNCQLCKRTYCPKHESRFSDDFSLVCASSKRKIWHVSTKGVVISEDRLNGKTITLRNSNHSGIVRVAISPLRDSELKRVMWKTFKGNIPNGYCITMINGDETDCRMDNLKLSRLTEVDSSIAGKSKRMAVIVKGMRYESVRKAAKSLNCSYQTLSDYLNKATGQRSCLAGIDIRYENPNNCKKKFRRYNRKKWGMPKGGWFKKENKK